MALAVAAAHKNVAVAEWLMKHGIASPDDINDIRVTAGD